MLKESIIQILLRKIQNGEINPKTGKSFVVADIILPEYREEVQARLNQ